jgi:competence protein ComEA
VAGGIAVKSWACAVLFALCGACSLAAQAQLTSVEVNLATLAQIEQVKGVGTQLAANILLARDQGAFKDWGDLAWRVKGIGTRNAARLSAQGLRVNGAPFEGVAAELPRPATAK